jgi:uncharacterized protein
MMTVPCLVAESPLHGFGVYATERIPKGTVIWQFHPLIDRPITEREFATLPPVAQKHVAHYSYKSEGVYVFCGDEGRYFNHSETPTTQGVESPDGYGMTIALRDINPGEELTSDYREFDDDLPRKKTENEFV